VSFSVWKNQLFIWRDFILLTITPREHKVDECGNLQTSTLIEVVLNHPLTAIILFIIPNSCSGYKYRRL